MLRCHLRGEKTKQVDLLQLDQIDRLKNIAFLKHMILLRLAQESCCIGQEGS